MLHTFTARGLASADTQELGGEAHGARVAETLVLGTLDQVIAHCTSTMPCEIFILANNTQYNLDAKIWGASQYTTINHTHTAMVPPRSQKIILGKEGKDGGKGEGEGSEEGGRGCDWA